MKTDYIWNGFLCKESEIFTQEKKFVRPVRLRSVNYESSCTKGIIEKTNTVLYILSLKLLRVANVSKAYAVYCRNG